MYNQPHARIDCSSDEVGLIDTDLAFVVEIRVEMMKVMLEGWTQ